MNPIVRAVIFLPAGVALDSPFAAYCLAHLTRRGYELLTVAREWPTVEDLLRRGLAQVVIFARRSHIDPDWTPRIEVVGEDTRDEVAGRRRPRNEGRHRAAEMDRPHLLP